MPTLKKLITQMDQNKSYTIEINNYIQQIKQTSNLIRGLKNNIPFETSVNEYKLTAKPYYPVGPYPQDYKFTITKNNSEFITGTISYVTKEQKFKITFNYDYTNDLKQLDKVIVQLFKTAI